MVTSSLNTDRHIPSSSSPSFQATAAGGMPKIFVGCKLPDGNVSYLKQNVPAASSPLTVGEVIEAALPRLDLQDANGRLVPIGKCAVFQVKRGLAQNTSNIQKVIESRSNKVSLDGSIADLGPLDPSDEDAVFLFVHPITAGDISHELVVNWCACN
jgi:hypothetical protein